MTSHAYMRFEVITENYLNARPTHVLMEPTTELKIPFDGHPISVKVYMVNENYRRILIVNSKKEGLPRCRLLFTGTADYKGEIVLLDEYGAPVAVLHNKIEVLDAIETIVKPYISHNTRELFVWIM